MKFTPGPGLGGHCIPVDPTYLSWKMKSLGFTARFIELATDVNGHMPEHVSGTVADLLNEDRVAVNGSRILILGVAYKKDVGDMRESPAADIILQLQSKGANVRFHDPHVLELTLDADTLKSVELSDDELSAADLVVIITDHSNVDYERVASHAHRIYDTRNATRHLTANTEKIRKL
jgi:UDP-N-acetyl-D-glucosamine dehydrogenase